MGFVDSLTHTTVNYCDFHTFLSECVNDVNLNCPHNGENYDCIDNVCQCKPGFALDGDECVGMLA